MRRLQNAKRAARGQQACNPSSVQEADLCARPVMRDQLRKVQQELQGDCASLHRAALRTRRGMGGRGCCWRPGRSGGDDAFMALWPVLPPTFKHNDARADSTRAQRTHPSRHTAGRTAHSNTPGAAAKMPQTRRSPLTSSKHRPRLTASVSAEGPGSSVAVGAPGAWHRMARPQQPCSMMTHAGQGAKPRDCRCCLQHQPVVDAMAWLAVKTWLLCPQLEAGAPAAGWGSLRGRSGAPAPGYWLCPPV